MNYVPCWVSFFFLLFIPHLDNAPKVILASVVIQESPHKCDDKKLKSIEASRLVLGVLRSLVFL